MGDILSQEVYPYRRLLAGVEEVVDVAVDDGRFPGGLVSQDYNLELVTGLNCAD